MVGRIIEVSNDNRHLSAYRGFLIVSESGSNGVELSRIPFDEISALITNAHGLTFTNNVLVRLSEIGAPLIISNAKHIPVSVLMPLDGNFETSKRIRFQILASKPIKKQIWSSIVKSKIKHQAEILELIGKNPIPLKSLIKKVKSGDSSNIEAVAARRYWHILFGKEFRRDRELEGINSLLNYGYIVLRSSVARAVVAAGLHPSIGIHHSNSLNPFCLVDDLMEPFRPIIDYVVFNLVNSDEYELNQNVKSEIVKSQFKDLLTNSGLSPTIVCVQRLATSLAQIYLGERKKIDLPISLSPLKD